MYLVLFNAELKFLTSRDSNEGVWSDDRKDALIHNAEQHEATLGKAIDGPGANHSEWMNPDDFRSIDNVQAINELIVQLDTINDGNETSLLMESLVGGKWDYLDNGEWSCDGKNVGGDDIIELINESQIDNEPLIAALNEHSNILYWEVDSGVINTTPAPDEDNFIDQIKGLHDQLESLIKFHMSDKGLLSSECQRMQMLLALSELEHSINGCTPEDFKSFNK